MAPSTQAMTRGCGFGRLVQLVRSLLCPRPRAHLTFFDLPRGIRDRIYSRALHDCAPQPPREDEFTRPYVPLEMLGLLRVSRQVYEEASAVLYQRVNLGSNACMAFDYLEFIGPSRRRQIRDMTIFYRCDKHCNEQRDYQDWIPVFELLWQSWACVRHVNIHFSPHESRPNPDGSVYLRTRCQLEWDESIDRFWGGLRTLSTAHEIRFTSPVPRYFVSQQAKRLGWREEGSIVGDGQPSGRLPLEPWIGKLVNPTYPNELDWVHRENELAEQGIDVPNRPLDCQEASTSVAPSSGSYRPSKNFLDLPLEIRLNIYDLACGKWESRHFWPDRPARWNAGSSLLLVSKQVSEEDQSSVFRTVRLSGGSPLACLNKVGPNISHVRTLEIEFSCFCSHGPQSLTRGNGSIFAAENPSKHFSSMFNRLEAWYPDYPLVAKYKDEWARVISLVKRQKCLQELSVTFLSCCRAASFPTSWMSSFNTPAHEIDRFRSCCLLLEDHFIDLLSTCDNVDKVSLAGNVPPSLATRLAQSDTGPGLSMKAVSKDMAAFMRAIEEDYKERETKGWTAPWTKTRIYPAIKKYTAATSHAPHFVLVKEGSALERWMKSVEGHDGIPAGMERPSGIAAVTGIWREVSEIMDYDNAVKNGWA